MRPENGVDSKFYWKGNSASEDRSVVRRKSGIKSALPVAPNNVQINTSKKDPHKNAGGRRSSFTPIEVSRTG